MTIAAICRWISGLCGLSQPADHGAVPLLGVPVEIEVPEVHIEEPVEALLPSVFLWVETPRQVRATDASLRTFYESILEVVSENSLKAQVTELIIRVATPYEKCAGAMIFANPSQSPLYEYLLKHLSPEILIRFYPYLGVEEDCNFQHMWADHEKVDHALYLTGVYKYVRWWNEELAKVGSPVLFTGITLDLEESIKLNPDELKSIKGAFPDIPVLGVSMGFDDVNWVYRYHESVDRYYAQMYDYYLHKGPSHICESEKTSPFVAYHNNPKGFYDWLSRNIIQGLPDVQGLYTSKHKSKLYLMWSLQNAGTDSCMYPLRGRCGHSYDFGTWTLEAFSEWMELISAPDSMFSGFGGHGIYEFAFIPKAWMLAPLAPSVPQLAVISQGDESELKSSKNNEPRPLPTVFLWVETPRQVRTDAKTLRTFYESILQVVKTNALKAQVTELIIRVATPNERCDGERIFAHPSTSPLFLYLLKHLSADTLIRFYPYLGIEEDCNYQHMWADHVQTDRATFLTGVYRYVEWWNEELAAAGSPVLFTGVTLDMGEDIKLNPEELKHIKAAFPSIPNLGISVGFDDVNWVYQYHESVDQYYLQVYNYYLHKGPRHICKSEATSPFIAHRNDPAGFYEWLSHNIVNGLPDVKELYSSRHRSKLFLMWSLQNAGTDKCMYPFRGSCGRSYDFGTWTLEAFSEWLQFVTSPDSIFKKFGGHGIFELAFIPDSWLEPSHQ